MYDKSCLISCWVLLPSSSESWCSLYLWSLYFWNQHAAMWKLSNILNTNFQHLLCNVHNYAVTTLAYSFVVLHLGEPEVRSDPSHCHSQFGALTVRFALARRAGRPLGGPCRGVQLVFEARGLPKVFTECILISHLRKHPAFLLMLWCRLGQFSFLCLICS